MDMRVFLSSTYLDLKEHRKAAVDVLEHLKLNVSRMEIFGARPEEPENACISDIKNCDIFIGLYAHRYGYVPPGSDISITEQEFRYAKSQNKPIFCFMASEDYPWPPRMIEDLSQRSKLKKFKNLINKSCVRDIFTTPEDLSSKIATSLTNYILNYEKQNDNTKAKDVDNFKPTTKYAPNLGGKK